MRAWYNRCMKVHKVLILGGGFVGVMTAKRLASYNMPNVRIRLISNRWNFEYHGALYRYVAGHSPLEVCIPLRDILDERAVDIVYDTVVSIDKESSVVTGHSGSTYGYDSLVIGLGSETNYFGIPGLADFSFGMKTIAQANHLRDHINKTLRTCIHQDIEVRRNAANIVIVGAGATGVELAGELAIYARNVCHASNLDPEIINIELIEAAPCILPRMSPELSQVTESHIRSLGVNVRKSRAITSIDSEHLEMSDMQMSSPTVIWTAGVKANRLLSQAGFATDRTGRIEVDEYQRAKGFRNIYVGGDAAALSDSGMAQTAIEDGEYFADCIESTIRKRSLPTNKVTKPIYAIPAGPGWAAVQIGKRIFTGKIGWIIRRYADWKVFRLLLPFGRAWQAFWS